VALLDLISVTKHFGGLMALASVDMEVEEGEIRGLIGPNGSGKTTLFNVVTGVFPLDGGSVYLSGRDITNAHTHKLIEMGIARTFQEVEVFPDMTVLENAMVGAHVVSKTGMWDAILGAGRYAQEESKIRGQARESLDFVGLSDCETELARNLPYGHLRMLEIARALSSDPTLLLLDEPSAGMNRRESLELMRLIAKIRERGTTVVLIEHNMKLVMDICYLISVLNHGEKIAEGRPAEIQADEQVIKAYLGRRRDRRTA
jgi:branched-chain amino acid transport system ATP-binding protein